MARRPDARPGDGLLHPVALAALAVLIVNDQLLKAVWPGVVTGKLSDVAGLIVAPLVLQALGEIGQWIAGRWHSPTRSVLVIAIIAVGLGFAAVQVWDPASNAYGWALGAAQWPFRAFAAVLVGNPPPSIGPVVVTADAEDLLALPALAVTWWVGRRRLTAA
ncbi:MAG TPA: hypothetical protein VGQ02_00495 [Candidatus Limnocylindrales bacterium]|nr:hypothetical protein [Candidatus Limnocylindrales bacterium]